MSRFSSKDFEVIFNGEPLKKQRPRFTRSIVSRRKRVIHRRKKLPSTNYSDEDGSSFDIPCQNLWQIEKIEPFKPKRFTSVKGGPPRQTMNSLIRRNSRKLKLETLVFRHQSKRWKLPALKCVTLVTLYGPYISSKLWRILTYGVKLLQKTSPKLRLRGRNMIELFSIKFEEFGCKALGTFSSMRKSGSLEGYSSEHPEDVTSSEINYSASYSASDFDGSDYSYSSE